MKKGLLIILSGPSGVGKGSVRHQLVKNFQHLNIAYSVSMTTRSIRPKEEDGVDYYFVTREEFQKRIEEGAFLEYAEFVGNYYGTPKDKVEELRNKGKNVFLEIEVNGATQVMQKAGHEGVISFFLMPPSVEALEERIRHRKSESEEVIQERLQKGIREMSMADRYDHVVLNDTIVHAANTIAAIIKDTLKSRKK